jgi:hypothetical protein
MTNLIAEINSEMNRINPEHGIKIDGNSFDDITFDSDNEPTEFAIPDGYEDNESSFEQWLRDRNDCLMDV